jgi:hypothetical protein
MKQQGYPAGLQVLCYNCNISKHRNGGVCEHKIGVGSEAIPSGSRAQAIGARSARPRKSG